MEERERTTSYSTRRNSFFPFLNITNQMKSLHYFSVPFYPRLYLYFHFVIYASFFPYFIVYIYNRVCAHIKYKYCYIKCTKTCNNFLCVLKEPRKELAEKNFSFFLPYV